jgi:hypothetical protein
MNSFPYISADDFDVCVCVCVCVCDIQNSKENHTKETQSSKITLE